MRPLEPRLSQFGPVFAWLLDRDVTAGRIASLFATTPTNVRVIAHRARHGNALEGFDETPLDHRPAIDRGRELGVRPGPDDVVRTPAKAKQIESLAAEIDETVRDHTECHAYLEGATALRRLLPRIGYAGDSRRVALRALLHQQIAWFLVHSGRCASAADQAQVARDLWRIAYHESGAREHVRRFIQSALIGSNALLLMRKPQEAWRSLDIADGASEAINAPIGSEHFRQRGVALFQLREDARAIQQFRLSAEAMEQLNEARVPAQLLMTGKRHANLIGDPNLEHAQELVTLARQSFGETSLEASMALHWAAACGLSTDSSVFISETLDFLNSDPVPASHFGHQATIHRLLAITPDLGFDHRLRRMWVRRALYENAFRAS